MYEEESASALVQMQKNERSHCRFCAASKSKHELLDLPSNIETFEQYLAIVQFFQIDYLDFSEGNPLPKATCESCYDSFTDSYEFFKKVKNAQVILNGIYNIKNENVVAHIKIEQLDEDCIEKVQTENVKTKLDVTVVPAEVVPLNTGSGLIYCDEKSNLSEKITKNCDNINDDCLTSSTESDEESETDTILLDKDLKVAPAVYGGIPVFENQADKVKRLLYANSDPLMSWATYPWACTHCGKTLVSMDDLRNHTKEDHNICYAFHCADCSDQFNTFNAFVEHVRQHREQLRLYCQYCNMRLDDQTKCSDHAASHWHEARICELCGELLPDIGSLDRHRRLYRRVTLPRKYQWTRPKVSTVVYEQCPRKPKSWQDYEWTCQECCIQAPDVAALRDHVQEVHRKCFAMKCVDCLKVIKNFRTFVDHVVRHRPYLKHYCQFCNNYCADVSALNKHVVEHTNKNEHPCEGCGQIFSDQALLSKHMKEYDSPRRRGTLTPEDLTCDICQKRFSNLCGFRKHRSTHNMNRERDYTCDQCGQAFFFESNLTDHMKRHNSASEVCQICNKAFHTRHSLKQHVATHSSLRPFICNECGKGFRTKRRLANHLRSHSDFRPYQCKICGKEFKYSGNLKCHEHTHTGVRPFSCEYCEKTFGNWANCNKHMIRKHGVTLARTKLTSHGRLEINRLTGKPKKVATDHEAKEWMKKMMERERRKKKET